MKIILVGASGTIGQAIDRELRERHDIDFISRDLPQLLASGRLKNAPVIMALQWLQQEIHTIKNV